MCHLFINAVNLYTQKLKLNIVMYFQIVYQNYHFNTTCRNCYIYTLMVVNEEAVYKMVVYIKARLSNYNWLWFDILPTLNHYGPSIIS
jgi:hypothetical protein